MDLVKSAKEAMAELRTKDLKQIQVETAAKWCGRAIAAKVMGFDERDVTEFAHEAIEHAALSGDDNVLRTVREAFDRLQIEV